jgi:tetratricopeptide (TPR) repeat protein
MTQDSSPDGARFEAEPAPSDVGSIAHGLPTLAEARHAALRAHTAGDYTQALDCWADIRRRFPAAKTGFAGALRSAKACGDNELVATLLAEGAVQFPQEAARWQALHAGVRPSDAEGEEAWLARMRSPPGAPEAELAAAIGDIKPRGKRNKAAYRTSLPRVEALLLRFPDRPEIYLAHLTVLRGLERFARAEALAARYAAKFPNDEKIALARIDILGDGKNFAAALSAATSLKENHLPSARVEVAYIQALSRAGQLDTADAACTAALAQFPRNIDLVCEHALLATRRGDWTEAFSRWSAAQAGWPESGRIRQGLDAARLQLAELAPPEPGAQQDETSALFGRFESLGGSNGGCEFGMVQRSYGSSALGLLRWSNIRPDALVEGLNNAFEGLGALENTGLATIKLASGREEYLIRDSRYGVGGHTFIDVKDVPEDKMLVQTAKRLKFLGARMIEEMRAARKIYVYKFTERVPDAALTQLFDAVRAQGPATLLCILKADDAHPKGSLRRVQDGLFAGYLGHFMSDAAGETRGIDFTTWKDLCTSVAAGQLT